MKYIKNKEYYLVVLEVVSMMMPYVLDAAMVKDQVIKENDKVVKLVVVEVVGCSGIYYVALIICYFDNMLLIVITSLCLVSVSYFFFIVIVITCFRRCNYNVTN